MPVHFAAATPQENVDRKQGWPRQNGSKQSDEPSHF
jgi:hypothetical protein